MPDILPTVGGDAGPREVVPVMLIGPGGTYAGTRQLYPLGYQQMAVATGSVSPAPVAPDGTIVALMKIEGAPVRYRDDGVNPTQAIGMPLTVGESLVYDAVMLDMRLIAQQGGAIVNIAYYGASPNA
ncbi:hypothetical protein QU926_20810 [Pseudomonas asiatica]|uniref:hypothetical protein n=1 Tax=Pseudomonas asiatica TaxID=2219225 RepID=UPI0025AB2572|nr:hypothetical protein [Pseudomonas asiatica]MDM9556058.1 hypothetical protein [Pseudomonas asiatica]